MVSVEEYLAEKNFNYPYRKSIATAGILRGSGECVKKAEEFWYIDHGYFHRTNHPPDCDGFYRIGYNTLWSSGEGTYTWDRFNSFKIGLGSWRRHGRHIVLVPPSKYMGSFLNRVWWLEKTQRELSKYTDRKILVSTKFKNPVSEVMKNAWCIVADHSNSAIDAMIAGIPAIFTNPTRKLGSIKDIETPPMDREFFKNLAHNQWTLEEIKSGKAWSDLNG